MLGLSTQGNIAKEKFEVNIRINGTRYGGLDPEVVIHLDYGAAGNGWLQSWYTQR